MEKVKEATERFKDEKKELKEECARVKSKLLYINEHYVKLVDQAEFLQTDRGQLWADKKYESSISEYITTALKC